MASQSSSRSRNQSSPSSCLPSHPPSQQTQYPTAEDVERKYQEAFIARHMPSEARNMESNTTSPTTPAHRAQYPSISLDLPSPQPFRLPLAGISASESEAGELSKFHSLENDGHFSEEVSELSNIRQSLGGFTKFTEMMTSGLAAVSLKISDLNSNAPLEVTNQLSGFRLGKDTIITSAHFTKWPTTWEAFEALARQYVSGENGIFEARQEREIKQTRVQFNTFNLKLVGLHLPWNLAVFSITTRPSGDDENETLSRDQIMFVGQSHELSSYKDWWSVGYNCLHDEVSFNLFWTDFYLRQSPVTRNMIEHQHGYNESTPPPMASFLKVDERTVSFGKIKYSPELRKKTSSCFIDLSAWHGRSGGMVCSQANGIVKVCGVVSGGNPEREPNIMVLFTEEMKEWFTAAVFERQDDLDKDYCEFLKCFVMSTSGVAATKSTVLSGADLTALPKVSIPMWKRPWLPVWETRTSMLLLVLQASNGGFQTWRDVVTARDA